MTVVVKRNNKKERFDEKKLKKSIADAARESRLGKERARRVVEEVSSSVIAYAIAEKETRSAEIRDDILHRLDKTAPSVSKAWRRYELKTRCEVC